ncbi:MMPL family transporter, partial [Streptococcus agalactiae]|nr:MMPL family transporter [Streptococcus agalactiae]
KFGDGMNGPLLAVAELDKPIAQDAVTSKQVEIGKQINKLAEVAAVVPVGASDNHKLIAYQVVPKHGPSAKQTETLVHQLRDMDHGYKMGVAGSTSAMIDVSEVISDALVPYLLIVIGLSFLILMVVFRSILVPLTATIGFALSVLGAFGGVTWVFQEGHLASLFNITTPGPVLSFLPIIMTGILFGLAM